MKNEKNNITFSSERGRGRENCDVQAEAKSIDKIETLLLPPQVRNDL